MTNLETGHDELLESQQNLLGKFQHSHRLFRTHFNLLVGFLISSVMATILLIFSLYTSLPPSPLNPYSVFQIVLLIIMIAIVGLQIRFYGSFLVKSNRSLNDIEQTSSALYYGLTSYVNTLSSVFNPSNVKKPLSQFLTYFFFLQFYEGFLTIFLFSNVADLANTNFLLEPVLATLLFVMFGFWVFMFYSSTKIKNTVQKWEDKFTKLDRWAQDLEADTSERAAFRGEDME